MGYVGNGSVHRRNHARIRRNLSTGRSILWRHIGALSGLPDGHYISYKQRYSQDNSRDAPLATRTTGCSNTKFHFNQWCIRYKLATLANNIFSSRFCRPFCVNIFQTFYHTIHPDFVPPLPIFSLFLDWSLAISSHAFRVSAPTVWNPIDNVTRDSQTFSTFKRHLKTHHSLPLTLPPTCTYSPLYIGWQWRNFVPYLCQLVFAAILWVKLLQMFVTLLSLNTLCW